MADDEEETVSQAPEKKKGGEGDDEDSRLEFLLAYLTKSLRMKQEKWTKMMQLEENKVGGWWCALLNVDGNFSQKFAKTFVCLTGVTEMFLCFLLRF